MMTVKLSFQKSNRHNSYYYYNSTSQHLLLVIIIINTWYTEGGTNNKPINYKAVAVKSHIAGIAKYKYWYLPILPFC